VIRACLVAIAALVVVAPAAAQDVEHPLLRLCGPFGCKTIDDPSVAERLAGFPQPRATAPPLAPYYEIRVAESWITPARFFVPGIGVVRTQVTGRWAWRKIDPRSARILREAVRDLAPWPVPTLTYVRIDGMEIGAAPAYARIFDELPPAPRPPYTVASIHVDLGSNAPSPWTDGWHDIEYVPARGLLAVDGRWLRPPAGLVEQIEHDLSLLRRPPPDESESRWPAAALALALGATAVIVSFVRRRLRARAV
jgi:hypothetical protein